MFMPETTQLNRAGAGPCAAAGHSSDVLRPLLMHTLDKKKNNQSALCTVCFVIYSYFFPVNVQTNTVQWFIVEFPAPIPLTLIIVAPKFGSSTN